VRPETVRAERLLEVRRAARAWNAAGMIDAATLATIESEYPDDRSRLSPALRTLALVFTFLGALTLLAFFGLAARLDESTLFPFVIVYGLGLAALTEWQTGPLRRAQGGTETATAVAAALCLIAGGVWLLDHELKLSGRPFETLALLFGCAVLGLAAARWGGVVFAAGSAVCLLLALSRGGAPRLTVALAGCLLLALGLWGEISNRAAPSHRRCFVALQLVGAAALYLALHLGSWDAALFEGSGHDSQRVARIRPLFVYGTAGLPLVLITLALIWRRRFLLAVGALALVASLVTVRFYAQVAPLWMVLTSGGLACMALAAVLERWLRGGSQRARGGFTAEPLFEDDRRVRVLEVAITAAQAGAPAPSRTETGTFRGGGGDTGGGGATTKF